MSESVDCINLAKRFARKWSKIGFQPTRVTCERFLKVFHRLNPKQREFIQKRWDWQMDLPLPKGKKGKPVPVGWQAMAHCYRWGIEAGVKGCSKVTLILITRKSGKTSFSATMALSTMKFSTNSMPHIYSLATKRDQATLTWRDGASMVKQMARRDGGRNQWDDFKALSSQIRCEENDGIWETLPSDEDTLDGLQFELAILDEAAQVPDGVYNVVRSAFSDTMASQHILAISTAGKSASNWFSRMIFEAVDRLDAGEDIEVNVLAWAVPELRPGVPLTEQEFNPETDVSKLEVWKKTHPTFGLTITADDLLEHYNEAKLFPTAMNEFRRTRLNQYTAKDINSLCTTVIQKAICNSDHDKLVETVFQLNPCMIGIDVSTKIDPTAVALLSMQNDVIYARTRNWVCKEAYDLKISRHRAKIMQTFHTDGLLSISGYDFIDYGPIQTYIQELIAKYNVLAVYSDTATRGMTLRNVIEGDLGIPVLDFGKNHGERSATKQYFLDKLYALELKCSDNYMFRWELDNAAVEEFPDGKRDIVKLDNDSNTPLTIDGVYAIVHALYPYAMEALQGDLGENLPSSVQEFKQISHNFFA